MQDRREKNFKMTLKYLANGKQFRVRIEACLISLKTCKYAELTDRKVTNGVSTYCAIGLILESLRKKSDRDSVEWEIYHASPQPMNCLPSVGTFTGRHHVQQSITDRLHISGQRVSERVDWTHEYECDVKILVSHFAEFLMVNGGCGYVTRSLPPSSIW